MNDEPTNQSAESAVAATTQAVSGDVEQFYGLMRRFGAPVVIGFVLAMILVIGLATFRKTESGKLGRAASALSTAATSDDYRHILDVFGDTPTAQIAELGLGARLFEEGRFAEARDAYGAFLLDHPDHALASAATLCLAQCTEASGLLEDAVGAYRDFVAKEKDHYLRPYAQLNAGRCLQQLQRWEEARTMYEDVIAGHPDTPWSQSASVNLDMVRRELRATAQ